MKRVRGSREPQESSSQSPAKRLRTSQTENSEQEFIRRAGKVQKIYVENFMCHNALEVSCNDNINFIVGRNGSGKSAILTALIVGLGGKASDTNRSSSIKALIKKGESSALVEITIRNTGFLAYKPEIYGSSITICRLMNSRGSSSYKIKSSEGAVISTKREDVQKIAAALKMMVDNPLCVLTQNTARNFLNSADPKKKYQFFIKATNLENLMQTVEVIRKQSQAAYCQLKEQVKDTNAKQKELDEKKQKIKKYKSISTYKAKKIDLKNEIKWVELVLEESTLDTLKNDIALKEEAIESIEGVLSQREEFEERLNKDIENINEELHKKKEECNEILQTYNEARSRERNYKENHLSVQHDIKTIERQITRNESDLKTFTNEILDQERKLAESDTVKIERDKKIEAYTKKEKELLDMCSTADRDLRTFSTAIFKAQETTKSYEISLRDINGHIRQTTSLLNQMTKESGNNLALYGEHMPNLVQLIKKAYDQNKFEQMPRGPLGNYVKVNEKKWAPAIEETIGVGILTGFLVHSSRDKDVLINIIKKNFPRLRIPTIITTKFFTQVHNIAPNMVQAVSGTQCLFNAITISDNVVANCLIDQVSIERLLLCNSEDKAMELMSSERNVPRNCSKTILLDGTLYYPMPNYRSYAGNAKVSKYLQTSIEERKAQLETELLEYQKEHTELKGSYQEKQKELKDTQIESSKLEEQIRVYHSQIRQLQTKVQQLRNEEDPQQSNIETLKEEVAQLKSKLESFEIDKNNKLEKLKEIKQKLEEVNKETTEAKIELKKADEKQNEAQEKLNTLKLELLKYNSTDESNSMRLKKTQGELKQLELDFEKQNKVVHDMKNEISDDYEKPENGRSLNILKEELRQTVSVIRSLNALMIDPEKEMEQYDRLEKSHNESKAELTKLLNGVRHYSSAARRRSNMVDSLKVMTSLDVKQSFILMLQLRQYKGDLIVDHESKTLNIHVSPKNLHDKNMNDSDVPMFMDLRSLSGGERSYCTVSFLIALWNNMNLPFYFLDEFDVFMDHMNRKVVMDVLMHNAGDNLHKQYVFLTPLQTSLNAGPYIKIHKLADPDRT